MWRTQTANSAARSYYEAMHGGEYVPLAQRIEVPTGCAVFPKETVRAPRAWAAPEPAARHPRAAGAGVMVAPLIRPREGALRIDRAPEFTAPDHESVAEHAPLF